MDVCGGTPFWNSSLTWYHSWPEFTSCFEDTFLVLMPCAWLWLTLPPYLCYIFIYAQQHTPLKWSLLTNAKIVVCVVLTLLVIGDALSGVNADIGQKPYTTMFFVGRSIQAATFIMAAIMTHLCMARGIISSGVLFIFWLLRVLADIVPLYTYIFELMYIASPFHFYIFLLRFPLTVIQLVLHCFAERRSSDASKAILYQSECPEISASFLSKILFWWMTKLIVLGFKKPLEEGDVWDLNPRDTCNTVIPKFEAAWRDEEDIFNSSLEESRSSTSTLLHSAEKVPLLAVEHSNSVSRDCKTPIVRDSQGPSLTKVLIKAFYPDLIKSYIFKGISDVLQFMSPLILSELINHIQLGESDFAWKGYVLALGLFVVNFLQSCFYHQQFHYSIALGMRIKATLMATIYKKAIFLKAESQKTSTVGSIVNLMAVDCQRIQDMIIYTWMIWSIPFQTCLAVYLLWVRIGPPVLAGLGVLVLLLPVNAFFAYRQQCMQRLNLVQKDKRIKILNEVLNGIKVLKLYAWEPSFMKNIVGIRQEEIRILMRIAYMKAFSTFIWTCAPYLVTLATFTAFVLTSDVHLDAGTAFVTLSLYNILQYPINFIPEMISNTAQARVSIERIDAFLRLDELDRDLVGKDLDADYVMAFRKSTCKWERGGSNTLINIDLHVSQGEVVAVVGQVGAGKSSLLSAVLGDMEIVAGTINRRGKIAYVPQQAWIQNATVQDNILFGREMDERRYRRVLSACSLTDDLDMLPAGDQTEIGEKGINLSGGQKQRVSLARAVYSDADIYLLDDPLSAVDSHVGKHIFKKVIGDKGILKNKTRVFVTHAIHWLPLVDTVVVLDEGRVRDCGSYGQLMMHDGPFAQFLKSYFAVEDNEIRNDEDPEIRDMKQRIYEHVEYVTSTSEAASSSGDEAFFAIARRRRKFTVSSGSDIISSRSQEVTDQGKLIDDEKAETGQVKLSVFWCYIRAVGVYATLVIFILFACYQGASLAANIVLSQWTEDVPSPNATNITGLPVDRYYLTIYGLLGAAQGVFILMYAYLASIRLVTAARNLHSDMLNKIIRSPMSFFDTTPLGRIVNRFSRDVETIDNNLPRIIFMYISTIFSVLSTLLVISISIPVFMAVVFPLAGLYYAIQRIFVPSSRQLKRLMATSRSPIFSHFSESISGASTIRAYGATDRFIDEIIKRIDKNQIFYFTSMSANRWLGIWIEFLSNCCVLAASIFALVTPGISGGAVGLSITYALQITQSLKWLIRTMSDLETNIVSVERVKEYSELSTEADWVNPYYRPNCQWPENGSVEFKLYTTRYRPGLPLVLKGVTCRVKSGEKIGIVGRTGAGKSSLTMALFRLVEAVGGGITLDGVVLEKLGLHDLRSRITILPQDPVIFSGSLRMNLDPFEDYSDDAIWRALEHAHLKHYVLGLPEGLNHECGEGGVSFSVGQRQLVCLARALLRKTKLLVLDEATAAVDLETDNLIQETIRREFSSCTILTIAHRINTIMDYDRILVMDAGKVQEFDRPQTLLMNKRSLFYALAKDAKLV